MSARAFLILTIWFSVISVPARDSLFGRKANKGDFTQTDTSTDTSSTTEKSKHTDTAKSEDPFTDKPSKERAKPGGETSSVEDVGVIIQPILMDQGWMIKEKMDFQLSRVDKPLAKETSALFRDAWSAFRTQNQIIVDGDSKRFTRAQVTTHELKAKLLQDLGDARWLVDAEWNNLGPMTWCPAGINTDKAILVLNEGQGVVGETLTLTVAHLGLVQARFDAKVAPANGRRITIRRHAFAASTPLQDDEATRELFQKSVAAGNAAIEAVVLTNRDCKTCGGLGYVRRSIPGKIQDARDPCPDKCDRGNVTVPVLLTFKP
jgi:hypothetical protein